MTERVNWIVDADIRNYFGTIDQSWMMRMVALDRRPEDAEAA